MTPCDRYFARYAEAEAEGVLAALRPTVRAWDEVVVLPLYAEGDPAEIIESLRVAANWARKRILTIAVVNAPQGAPILFQKASEKTLHALQVRRDEGRPLGWGESSDSHDLLWIDRVSPGREIASTEGVGTARKIGCDVAVRLWKEGLVRATQVRTTDADARVSLDYFVATLSTPLGGFEGNEVAWLHPYAHETEGDRAHELYEASLRYYVYGLRLAGSPYAFPTIGSTLSFHPESYAAVGGFPKRAAAEDFHFLNKLAKLGIVSEAGGLVRLRPRVSSRVPFGTGVATQKINSLLLEGKPYLWYHPRTFALLKAWLTLLDRFAEEPDLFALWQGCEGAGLCAIVEPLGAKEALLQAARTRPTVKDRRRHLHTWFDALKTLRFIHGIRDNLLPLIPWEEAIASLRKEASARL